MWSKTSQKIRKSFSAFIFIAFFAVGLGLLIFTFFIPESFIQNAQSLISRSLGFGPLLFILLETIQCLLPVVSGQPLEVLGGALFGWWALPLSLVGSLFAYSLAFFLSRKYGTRLLNKFVDQKILKKFDFFLSDRSGLMIFVASLIPVFPDDIICYGGGLTQLSYKRYILAIALGRPLTLAINTALGIGLATKNIAILGASIAALAIIVFSTFIKRKQLTKLLRKFATKKSKN